MSEESRPSETSPERDRLQLAGYCAHVNSDGDICRLWRGHPIGRPGSAQAHQDGTSETWGVRWWDE